MCVCVSFGAGCSAAAAANFPFLPERFCHYTLLLWSWMYRIVLLCFRIMRPTICRAVVRFSCAHAASLFPCLISISIFYFISSVYFVMVACVIHSFDDHLKPNRFSVHSQWYARYDSFGVFICHNHLKFKFWVNFVRWETIWKKKTTKFAWEQIGAVIQRNSDFEYFRCGFLCRYIHSRR